MRAGARKCVNEKKRSKTADTERRSKRKSLGRNAKLRADNRLETGLAKNALVSPRRAWQGAADEGSRGGEAACDGRARSVANGRADEGGRSEPVGDLLLADVEPVDRHRRLRPCLPSHCAEGEGAGGCWLDLLHDQFGNLHGLVDVFDDNPIDWHLPKK